MGSSQSIQEEDEEDDGECAAGDVGIRHSITHEMNGPLLKKILEQEPETLPCYPSASPLSPQLSSSGTPRFESSIKVWDPYNFLVPPPPPPPFHFTRTFSFDAIDDDQMATEVFLISHGECEMSLKPELMAGRCPESSLTPLGRRQARALAVFLNSQGVRFNSVYSSPLSRARETAISVCQEMKFPKEQIESAEEVSEMSWGEWEGCHLSEINSPGLLNLMESQQPDFSPPQGESLRQVEFRMAQFLSLLVKRRSGIQQQQQQQQKHQSSMKKTFSKSRLMLMSTSTTTSTSTCKGSPHEPSRSSISSSSVGVFTHPWPIKCAVTGVLGCSPLMSQRVCVEDSSMTVLRHSWRTGWKVKRLNDTPHIRLL